jgi:hypothetical protein
VEHRHVRIILLVLFGGLFSLLGWFTGLVGLVDLVLIGPAGRLSRRLVAGGVIRPGLGVYFQLRPLQPRAGRSGDGSDGR